MVFGDHIVPTAHHRICVLSHAALVSGLGGYHSMHPLLCSLSISMVREQHTLNSLMLIYVH